MSSTLSSVLLAPPRRASITKLTKRARTYQHASTSKPSMTWLAYPCNVLNNLISPVIPKTTKNFVHFLFWHSIVMTMTTPLSRLLSKTESWYGKLIIPTIMNSLGLSKLIFGHTLNDVYLAYPNSASIDRAFVPHAFFGMLWLIMAYLHICHSKTLQKYIERKKLAYLASISFLSHIICSVRCLWLDPMKHHPLPRVLLLSSAISATESFITGVREARNGNLKGHETAMMNCFLYSIEGAGTIRTVGYILALMGKGPTFCQQDNKALASSCVWPYILRLIGIRMLTLLYQFLVAQMPGPNKKERWILYKNEANVQLISFSVIFAIFSLFDNAEEITTYAPVIYAFNFAYTYILPRLYARK